MTDFTESQTRLVVTNNSRVAPGVTMGSFTATGSAIELFGPFDLQMFGNAYGVFGIAVTSGFVATTTLWGSAFAYGSTDGIRGAFRTITSYGDVYGAVNGINTFSSQPFQIDIANHGSITGGAGGIVFGIEGSAQRSPTRVGLENTGSISGDTFGVAAYFGLFELTNDGTIRGETAISVAGIPTFDIENTGTIQSTVSRGVAIDGTGSGASSVTNSGRILGSIVFGDGIDAYRSEFGTTTGSVSMGGGNDFARGGSGRDEIYGGAGLDQLSGGDGNDLMFGDGGGDRLSGEGGNDALYGGADSDVLDGGTGNDVMEGGAGDDTYYVDSALDRIFEDFGEGIDTVYASVSYDLRASIVERLAADPSIGASPINLTGSTINNTLTGNDGVNRLDGKQGADTMIGLGGDDVYYVDLSFDTVTEAAGGGIDTVLTAASFALPDNVETLRAIGTANLALTGNESGNTLIGNIGNNRLDGGAGADTMSGGDGNDTYVVDNRSDLITDRSGIDMVEASVSFTLVRSIENLTLAGPDAINGTGHVGANVIIGNVAANVLSGRGGFDQLTGGGGADTFVMASAINDSINLAAVTDFDTAADRIGLDLGYFKNVGGAGTLDARYFTDGAPMTADQRIVYDATDGTIFYDRDGSGTRYEAIAFATVTAGTVLDHTDFVLV